MQLGLVDVADSMIGSGVRRGISGGEKRRLSIGLELLAAPDILIADEPTSGAYAIAFFWAHR
jgi:ABC-type multidrug transport system ATPase subunit